METEDTGIVELMPELCLILTPGPEDSPKYKKEWREFSESLEQLGIKVTRRQTAHDAGDVDGTDLTLVIMAIFGPFAVAIAGLGKRLETHLKLRAGRRFKLKNGSQSLEGDFRDVQEFITPSQIKKLRNPWLKTAAHAEE